MKRKIYDFITKSNQILLFLAAILVIFMLSKDILREFFRDGHSPPKVQITEESDREEAQETIYTKNYLIQIDDVYVFKIKTNIINTSNKHQTVAMKEKSKSQQDAFSYTSVWSDLIEDNTVNFMFVRESGAHGMLLEKDAYIASFSETRVNPGEKDFELNKNIYLIATSDTNNDGYLSGDDQYDMYSSLYDGTELKEVLSDITDYRLIGDNRLLITQGAGHNKTFYVYQVDSGSLLKLNTEIDLANKPTRQIQP